METTVGAVKSKILQTDFRVRSENSTIYNISVLQERKKEETLGLNEKNEIKGKTRRKEKEKRKEGIHSNLNLFIFFGRNIWL